MKWPSLCELPPPELGALWAPQPLCSLPATNCSQWPAHQTPGPCKGWGAGLVREGPAPSGKAGFRTWGVTAQGLHARWGALSLKLSSDGSEEFQPSQCPGPETGPVPSREVCGPQGYSERVGPQPQEARLWDQVQQGLPNPRQGHSCAITKFCSQVTELLMLLAVGHTCLCPWDGKEDRHAAVPPAPPGLPLPGVTGFPSGSL